MSSQVTTPEQAAPPSDPETSSPDAHGMGSAVRSLPEQLASAWRDNRSLQLSGAFREPRAVLVVGMGGSAIGGDLAASALATLLPVPMVVTRDYRLPTWVGPETFVLASSFSGNTEETLSAWEEAAARGALRVALTSGGRLADLAGAAGAPIVRLEPGGAPRAALGRSLAGMLAILCAAGLVERAAMDEALAEACAAMRALVEEDASGTDASRDQGPLPLALADLLAERMAMIYTPEALAPVGRRWKAQLNENAKVTALCDTLPELDHNTVVGYGRPSRLGRLAQALFLATQDTHPAIERRIPLTAELLARAGWPHTLVRAPRAEGPAGAPTVARPIRRPAQRASGCSPWGRPDADPELDWLKERLTSDAGEGKDADAEDPPPLSG